MSEKFTVDFPYIEQVPRLQLSIEDAAAACGVPVSTFELECRRGRGPRFFTIGRRKFTTVELIREWQAKKFAEAETGEVA